MHKQKSRQIRLFISSTFRDMQQERDYLVKFTFPQLRKMCEERGVVWSEVDLRWGITNEQSAEDQVLPICFHEIDDCRSFFIGILGERYGWIPEQIDDTLLEREEWMRKHAGASVTEFEIVHGALNNPKIADYSFFYFRNPNYINTLPDETHEDYSEIPQRTEIQNLGLDEARRRANGRKEKLENLKNRIRTSGLHLKESFNSPQQLGEWVFNDFSALIDSLFPKGSEPTELQREINQHEAFAASKAYLYVGGEKYFEKINHHITNSRTPLVVLGESGIGKSALLANWGLRFRERKSNAIVLFHFCGSSTHSGNWNFMLRRIMQELQEHLGLEGEIPEDSNEMRKAFPEWLRKAGQKQNIVLILDALNQLEDKEGAQDLIWLPYTLPDNTTVIISTLPGKALDAATQRGYEFLNIEPLTKVERQEFIVKFLAQYSKQLDSRQLEEIASDSKSSNPLSLKIMLDELRQFGSFEKLNEIIQSFLATNTITEMLKLVFKRYEVDYETERPHLVKDTLGFLWASRQGLSEMELLHLLGNDGLPLAQAIWSPLHLALGDSILEHNGLINFSHQYIRRAVEEQYLPTDAEKKDFHQQLAAFFQIQEGFPIRKVIELPWQFQKAEAWNLLYNLLIDPDFFLAQWKINRNDLFSYWAMLKEKTNTNIAEAYHSILESTRKPLPNKIHDNQIALLNGISLLLMNTGNLEKSIEFLQEHERICRLLNKTKDLQVALGNMALAFKALGRLEPALEILKSQETVYREMNDKDGLQKSLGNQGLILQQWGKFEEALRLHREKERICREIGNDDGLQTALGNQAVVVKATGQLEEAMRLYKEQERICKQTGNLNALHINYGNQGLILNIWKKPDEAMRMQQEKERIARELGDLDGIQVALGNQAVILQGTRKFEECTRLLKEKERICLEIKNAEGLCTSWVYLGGVFLMTNQKESGLDYLRKAFALADQHKFTAMAAKIKVMLDKFA